MSGNRNRNGKITPAALEDQATFLFPTLFPGVDPPMEQIEAIAEDVGSRLIRGREHLPEASEVVLAAMDNRIAQEASPDVLQALRAVRGAVHLIVTDVAAAH